MSEQSTTSIPMEGATLRLYQGVAAGTKVAEAHASQPIDDFRTRLNLFWFYVGAVAVDEYGCKEPDELAAFITGAATQAPPTPPDPSLHTFVESGVIDGVRYVTVVDRGVNPVEYDIPIDDARSEYGDCRVVAHPGRV